MSFGFYLFLQGVIKKYGEKAHMSCLQRDNTCRAIFLNLEDSRSHGKEAEAERGQALGARPVDLGVRPLLELDQDSLLRLRSTDLKDESKPYNQSRFDPTAQIHLKGLYNQGLSTPRGERRREEIIIQR